MKKTFFLLFSLLSSYAFSQLTPLSKVYDFGNVTDVSNRVAEFKIVNNYKFTAVASLSISDFEISNAYSSYSIKPGDTLIYRVKIIPQKTGAFYKKIALSFFQLEDEVSLELKANVISLNFKDKSYVEAFELKVGKGDEAPKKIPFELIVLDKETKKPIKNATVNFSANILPYKSFTTNEKGQMTRTLSNSYKLRVYAPFYNTANLNISLGCDDTARVIYLTKHVKSEEKTEYQYFEEYLEKHAIGNEEDSIPTSDLSFGSTSNADSVYAAELKILEPLTENEYKPNNIVFLMDVSSSMTEFGRIELLKYSLIQMLKLMRPKDLVTIIIFSNETEVIFPTGHLDSTNRHIAINKVKQIKAGGVTNAGSGLKQAYKIANTNFGIDKNNQIILATDGGLNAYISQEKVLQLVKKHAATIQTSILAIKGYPWSKTYLTEIVRTGHGKLLPINSEKDAKTILIKEVKNNSIIIGK